MSAKRPSRPWKLHLLTPGGIHPLTFRSHAALLRAAAEERARIAAGTSRVTGLNAYQWDDDRACWRLFERLMTVDPTEES